VATHFGRQGDPHEVLVGNSADSYLTDARGRKSTAATRRAWVRHRMPLR
jgi:hypothetical protein